MSRADDLQAAYDLAHRMVAGWTALRDAPWDGLLGEHAAIPDLLAVVRATQELSHFLDEEKETKRPPDDLLDLGYVAVETAADYDREDRLTIALLDALAAFEAGGKEET